jgi:outer membrane receptor protein involved in Fe transport
LAERSNLGRVQLGSRANEKLGFVGGVSLKDFGNVEIQGPVADDHWSDMAGKADKLSADDKRDTQRISPGGTPGYAVFHVRTGTQLTKNIELSLALENIFDKDYRIHGPGANEPGRNLVLTANCTFRCGARCFPPRRA